MTFHFHSARIVKNGCVKHQSNLMLAVALTDNDALYWEMDGTKQPSPKWKHPQAEEKSLDNSILTIKMAMSTKKMPKLVLKGSNVATAQAKPQTWFASNSQMVTLQVTSISQLMEMVSVVQQEKNTIMSWFNQLTEQISVLFSAQQNPMQCPAGGHRSESGHPTQ